MWRAVWRSVATCLFLAVSGEKAPSSSERQPVGLGGDPCLRLWLPCLLGLAAFAGDELAAARPGLGACLRGGLARCRLPLGSCAHTSWERARPWLASGSTREKRGRLARGSVTQECSLGLRGGEVTPCLGSGLFLAGALWVSVLGAVNRHEPFHLATSPGEAGSGLSSVTCAAQWARGERP